jgi:SNF2 family DNA or RNA helicase
LSRSRSNGRIKPSRDIIVTWQAESKASYARELWKDLDDNGLTDGLPLTTKITICPTATDAEVRDLIRAKFNLPDLSAQIKTLTLLPSMTNFMEADWTSIQQELWEDKETETSLRMTLRKADDGEEVWENGEVPGLSGTVLTTEDGDVQPIITTASASEDDSARDALIDTINKCAGTKIDFLDGMIEKHFKGRREDLLKFFTIDDQAYDVEISDGLLSFQRKLSEKLTRRDTATIKEDAKSTAFGKKKLTPAQLEAFNEARSEGQLAALSLPDHEGESRHYALNAMYSGTQSQVGLPIKPCAVALQMTAQTEEHGRIKYISSLPGLQKTSFYPYQVSGAATCLIGMLGYIPLPEDASQDVRNAADSLKGLAIGGKFICDQTGMGKSILLLIILYFARYHIRKDSEGKRVYKMNKLVVPSGVIKQWADEMLHRFPDLKLIISYDESSLPERKYQSYFVKATAIKNVDHPEVWPERFRYIFDETNPDTGLTIMLTSQDTLATRALEEEEYMAQEGVKFDPPVVDGEGATMWEIDPVYKKRHIGLLKGAVCIAAVDEAQRLKDKESQRWKAFDELKAEFVFVLGATPMANVGVVSLWELVFNMGETDTLTGRDSPIRTHLALCGARPPC